MTDRVDRVALLARPGPARERLEQAIGDAGATLVHVADPLESGLDAVLSAAPKAVVVALEPAVEDALEAYAALLEDPAVLVIFDEAELAAQRSGWDAARWVRHLSAKLHGHDDVLPPGAEDGGAAQPEPGATPPDYGQISDAGLAAIAGEAQARISAVPRGLELAPAEAAGPVETTETVEPPAAPAWSVEFPEEVPGLAPAEEFGSVGDVEASALDGVELGGQGIPEFTLDSAADAGLAGEIDFGSFDLGSLELDAVEPTAAEAPPPDFGEPLEAGATDGGAIARGLDEYLSEAADETEADPVGDASGTDGARIGIDAAPAWELGAGFSLDAGTDDAAGQELADLEARISGLSLADPDSYGHGPERGAVIVHAGLGGPDAVRQLLAAMPVGFPRPVLVRLRLDGGRYERLVRQMDRATELPVVLAEADGVIDPGHVYFLPPDIGVRREKGRLGFVQAEEADGDLPEALPAGDSAVLFLSGSDPALVEAAMGWSAAGALVAGQAPEGCYDPAASAAVTASGGTSGLPAQLAAQLAGRWPPAGADGASIEEFVE